MASLYRGGKRAGASKRTLAQRKKDNAGVKSGTLRKGKGGRLNVYDAKTGTWKRAVKTPAVKKRATATAKLSSAKKATTATERRRDAAMASRRTSTASTRSTPTNRVTSSQSSAASKSKTPSNYANLSSKSKAAAPKQQPGIADDIRRGIYSYFNSKKKTPGPVNANSPTNANRAIGSSKFSTAPTPAKPRAKPKAKPKVVKKTDKYIYYANGTKKKI